MSIKIEMLSQLDLEHLRAFTEEPFNSDGIILVSEDEGVEISVGYLDGVIRKSDESFARIKGIPKKVKPSFSGKLFFQVSIENSDFEKLNEEYFLERLPTFRSIYELVKKYLPLIMTGRKVDSTKLFARLKPTIREDVDLWLNLLSFINYGVILPEHLEIIYGDNVCRIDYVAQSLKNLIQKKKYKKSSIERVWIRPINNANHLLNVKLQMT